MIWKYSWKSWLSETLQKILSTSLVESKWGWGRQNEKDVEALLYRGFWKQTLESASLQNWSQVALDQPGSIKPFASPRSALHSLPSCTITEWIAIGEKLNLHLKIFSVENESMELSQIYRDHRPRHFWTTQWLWLSNWKTSLQKWNSLSNSWTLETHKGRQCWKIMASGKHMTSKFQVRVTWRTTKMFFHP